MSQQLPSGVRTQAFKLLSSLPAGIRRLSSKEAMVQCLYLAVRLKLYTPQSPQTPIQRIAEIVPGATEQDCLRLLLLLEEQGFITYSDADDPAEIIVAENSAVTVLIENLGTTS